MDINPLAQGSRLLVQPVPTLTAIVSDTALCSQRKAACRSISGSYLTSEHCQFPTMQAMPGVEQIKPSLSDWLQMLQPSVNDLQVGWAFMNAWSLLSGVAGVGAAAPLPAGGGIGALSSEYAP
ncbi:hypothetical protein FHX15_001747 [Rhizobium sp. BK650]|uniref:hypothetical protein n=1 Tax=Rhizobium sp. BK650 TaxID=2586990 RepID=UPI00160E0D37|nr:hypothetical protein [Rhizobium sp. BK650]MBB3656519.1 hypothetical protein [Rhizobium sp. BK650]